MRASGVTDFGYRVARTAEGWCWAAFDTAGRTVAEGVAPSRAVAAALVIREIARRHAPTAGGVPTRQAA